MLSFDSHEETRLGLQRTPFEAVHFHSTNGCGRAPDHWQRNPQVNFFEKVPLTGLPHGTTFVSARKPPDEIFLRSEVLRGYQRTEKANR